MAKSVLAKQNDGTLQITITVPKEKVKTTQDEVVDNLAKKVELPGFRKGNAPKKLVEQNLNQEQVREETLKKLLPQAYVEAVQEHDLKPIMNPKIHIDKIEDGQDWTFTVLTCELPDVNLTGYKDNVQKITAKSKIVIPGKEQQKPSLNEIVQALLDGVKVKIPSVLTEQEVDRLLAQLLDDIKKLGLNLEQYLASTKRTPEDLRKEYAKKAEEDIKLELTLQKIAETEKITVGQEEIEEAIRQTQDPKEKQNLEANRYLLANILRQQKTLDFLMNL